MPDELIYEEGRKYVWDGAVFESAAQAKEKAAEYEKAGFQTQVVGDSGKHYVYSRRVAAQQTAS